MEVTLDLSCPEHHHSSKFPKAIRELIYRKEHDDLFSMIPNRYCSPHSGGPVSYTHLTLPTICSV